MDECFSIRWLSLLSLNRNLGIYQTEHPQVFMTCIGSEVSYTIIKQKALCKFAEYKECYYLCSRN